MHVVVVGAGLAGMTCGWTLHRQGVQVTVLEARERVGGRTFSHTFPDGTTVERGGEYIDAEHHSLRLVCAELGLPLISHGITFGRRTPLAGTRPSVEEVGKTMATLHDAIGERLAAGLPDCSVHELFTALIGPDFARQPTCQRLITSMASDPRETSALMVLSKADGPYVDAACRVLGGNQRIAAAMAEDLGSRVQLAREVCSVEDAGSHAVVTLADGGTIHADAVVVAIPLPLLEALEWTSPFPAAWRPGLDQLGFGQAAKLSLQLSRPAAPLGVQSPEGNWWSWNSLDPCGDAGIRAVTAFAGGPGTVSRLLAEGMDSWQQSLVDCRPDLKVQSSSAIVTDWQSEPFTRGAYSYARTGWQESYALDLQTRQGRFALAGEHTAAHRASTMNGAVASGIRAAQQLLKPYRQADTS